MNGVLIGLTTRHSSSSDYFCDAEDCSERVLRKEHRHDRDDWSDFEL